MKNKTFFCFNLFRLKNLEIFKLNNKIFVENKEKSSILIVVVKKYTLLLEESFKTLNFYI